MTDDRKPETEPTTFDLYMAYQRAESRREKHAAIKARMPSWDGDLEGWTRKAREAWARYTQAKAEQAQKGRK